MDVGTAMITMPREQARDKLRAFRRDTNKDAEQLYSEAAKGYEALAAGTPLIQLSRAIQQGGFDSEMRPKLAIARADRREVKMSWQANRQEIRFDTIKRWQDERHENLVINVGVGRTHGMLARDKNGNSWGYEISAFALVPMVPADVRPTTGQLKEWCILWEVDHWYQRSQTAMASRDPLLLKRIGGDLWAVLAQWDLTPLEMAILEARPRT